MLSMFKNPNIHQTMSRRQPDRSFKDASNHQIAFCIVIEMVAFIRIAKDLGFPCFS